MANTIIERWETRGGKYVVEFSRHSSGKFDIRQFTNGSQDAASVGFTFDAATERLAKLIEDSAIIDGIHYKQTYTNSAYQQTEVI